MKRESRERVSGLAGILYRARRAVTGAEYGQGDLGDERYVAPIAVPEWNSKG